MVILINKIPNLYINTCIKNSKQDKVNSVPHKWEARIIIVGRSYDLSKTNVPL